MENGAIKALSLNELVALQEICVRKKDELIEVLSKLNPRREAGRDFGWSADFYLQVGKNEPVFAVIDCDSWNGDDEKQNAICEAKFWLYEDEIRDNDGCFIEYGAIKELNFSELLKLYNNKSQIWQEN